MLDATFKAINGFGRQKMGKTDVLALARFDILLLCSVLHIKF